MIGLEQIKQHIARDPMNIPGILYLIFVLLSFLALEFFGIWKYGRPGTLTAHVQMWSNYHPLVPFFLGCSVGGLAFHFWQKLT